MTSAGDDRPGAGGAPTAHRRRLFFALVPDQALRARLAAALHPVLEPVGGRHVPAERLHLTLVFLGEVAADRIPGVASAAGGVRATPFELVCDHTGHWRRAGILWLGPRPCAGLDALHAALRTAIASCGIPLEDRPYRPHVTLARKLRRPPPPVAIGPIAWPVRDFVLMESAGEGYLELARWDLE